VIGLTLRKAKQAISRAGCRIGRIRRARSGRKVGIVIGQRPKAKALVRKGTAVALVVSAGRSTHH